MAKLLWGQVYYKTHYAGRLYQEPGERAGFTYDESYLDAGHPAIAYTLPLQAAPHISQAPLPPFFDNLVAEGWLEQTQVKLLGKRSATRFELLLAYGHDCAGAVSVLDPEPVKLSDALANLSDPKELAVLHNRASLSGVQPKLTLVKRGKKYFPAEANELSTHIAKFPSSQHNDLIINEYITTQAFKALLPNDATVELTLDTIEGFSEPALIIKRFDRENKDRIHFEEFNQLLGYPSHLKYEAEYKEMPNFIKTTSGCLPTENYRLFLRILAGFLLGNTDMHLKNFAMFHTESGLRLTPSYDQVSAALYNYKTLALKIAGTADLPLGSLKKGNILKLGKEFSLPDESINMAVKDLEKKLDSAETAILEADTGDSTLKDQLIKAMRKRWNGTYALIGQDLSKKR